MLPKRFHRLKRVLARRQPDLTVLMDRVNKPHNLSAVVRSCDAVGVLEIHAVPSGRRVTIHPDTSGGTGKWVLIRTHESAAAGLHALRGAGFAVVAADPGKQSVDFREVDYTVPTVLLMGAELYGVSEDALALADLTIRIPMVGMVRSLNVSVASALLLYEAYRQREAAGMYEVSRLDPERRARLLFEWAYPDLARAFQERGADYPELDPDGQIVGSRGPSTG
jgi:tRNA (guanosine-2'-O-)-methyltransferase